MATYGNWPSGIHLNFKNAKQPSNHWLIRSYRFGDLTTFAFLKALSVAAIKAMFPKNQRKGQFSKVISASL